MLTHRPPMDSRRRFGRPADHATRLAERAFRDRGRSPALPHDAQLLLPPRATWPRPPAEAISWAIAEHAEAIGFHVEGVPAGVARAATLLMDQHVAEMTVRLDDVVALRLLVELHIRRWRRARLLLRMERR